MPCLHWNDISATGRGSLRSPPSLASNNRLFIKSEVLILLPACHAVVKYILPAAFLLCQGQHSLQDLRNFKAMTNHFFKIVLCVNPKEFKNVLNAYTVIKFFRHFHELSQNSPKMRVV